LNAMLHGDIGSWPLRLPAVQYTYNTTVHRRHGSTPFSLFFARPHNPMRGEAPSVPKGPLTDTELAARAKLMSEVVFPATAARTRSYAEAVHRDFIKKHKMIANDYPQGALVMRQVIPRPSKLAPAWEGPYVVVSRSRGGPYILRDSTNEELVQKVPASRLRLISYEGHLAPDSFEVERLVDHRGQLGSRQYLVRWKGFAQEYDSWVEEKDIETLECISDYWQSVRAKAPAATGQAPPAAVPATQGAPTDPSTAARHRQRPRERVPAARKRLRRGHGSRQVPGCGGTPSATM
jgi:Chromo (CHRromatin Organisation MOdifier) domain